MILLLLIFLQGKFSAIGGAAWNSLVRDVIPEDRLGSFFGKRQRMSLHVGVPISLGAAVFLAWWGSEFPERELMSYSVLFFLGFCVGLIGLYYVALTPEPMMDSASPNEEFHSILAELFYDSNFRRPIAFLGLWNFGIALAAPFFTVYLPVRLGYGMPIVIALAVLSQLSNAAVASLWARLSDAFSNKAVLGLSGPLVLISLLLWLFTATPDTHRFTLLLLVIIHILLGVAMSGVGLDSGNIGMKLAPRGRATAYLAATSVIESSQQGWVRWLVGQSQIHLPDVPLH